MEDLNYNFINDSIELYSKVSSETALMDANVFFNSENLFGKKGSEFIAEAFPNTEIDEMIIREELYRINQKPIYNKLNVTGDIQEKIVDGYSATHSSYSDNARNESSDGICCQFNIPFMTGVSILGCALENRNLKVNYFDGRRFFQITYSSHSLNHIGDRRILFQAVTIGKGSSFVVTDEYEKTNKKNLGYDLRINGIANYSLWNVLPLFVVKNLITRVDMLEKAKKLQSLTNRQVSKALLIETVRRIKKEDPETSSG